MIGTSTPLRKAAINSIEHFNKKFQKEGITLKIGYEMEFMAFADDKHPGAESLDVKKMQRALEEKFPNKIERFYKEFPIGFTSDDEGFEFPGVQKYEVTFVPTLSPLEVCELGYQVKEFLESLQKTLHVKMDFSSKPIRNEEIESYVKKVEHFPEEVIKENIVYKATGCGTQFNISLWQNGKNVFFDQDLVDGTALFYKACAGLIEATGESILPFVGGNDAFLRLNPEDDETAAPGSCKVRDWKGGVDGRGIIRPSPLSDEIIGDDSDVPVSERHERRTNESFRMETRHNDPLHDQYVCMAAVLSSIYYGIKNVNLSKEQVKNLNHPFAKNMDEAIRNFEKSTLWKEILLPDLFNEVLNNAKTCALLERKDSLLWSKATATSDAINKQLDISNIKPRRNKI